MTMSKGDFNPATFTILPSLILPPRKYSNWLSEPSAIQTSPFGATPMPISPRNFSLNGKSLSLATGLPSKSMTRIFPLKLVIQTRSLGTAGPEPTPSMPMPVKPGIGGESSEGVGWGTAVTNDRVWITSFNGKILVMDFDGKPVASESDFPFKEKFLGLMGIGVAPNGDVWIADGSDNQLLYFPGGR